MRHPWELTTRQLIDKLRREHGIEVEMVAAPIPFPGSVVRLCYVVRPGSTDRRFLVLEEQDLDQPLTLSVLRSYCSQLGFPPELLGVGSEPED